MSSVVVLKSTLLEGATPTYSLQLVNENSDKIEFDSLVTLTLTYYDMTTQTVINTRLEQGILASTSNTHKNNVSVSDAALVTWVLQVGDTVLVDDRKDFEKHVALFTWSWQDGSDTKIARHEVQLTIEGVPLG